jgi:hypothetical protein
VIAHTLSVGERELSSHTRVYLSSIQQKQKTNENNNNNNNNNKLQVYYCVLLNEF